MLVDHLLSTLADQNHHEAVKTDDGPTELEAVHQEQRHRHLIPTYLLKNSILQIIIV